MDNYLILDVRGLIVRAWSAADKTLDDDGTQMASWQDGLANFLDRELIPILENGWAYRQVIACWDAGNDYRIDLYESYKLKRRSKERSEMRSREMKNLFGKARELMAYLGIKQVQVAGEEADDLIALLCETLEANYIEVHTVDEDLLQLLSPTVSIKHGHRLYSHAVDAEGFTDKGTSIRHHALYKSIIGDSSDEYLGVRGIGKKAFETLQRDLGPQGLDWLEHIVSENLPSQLKSWCENNDYPLIKKLSDNFSDWRLGYLLAKLHPEVCFGKKALKNGIAPKRPEWHVRIPNRDRLNSILTEINSEFHLGKFEHLLPQERLLDASQSDQLQAYATEILSSPIVSWDYESSDKKKHACYREASQDGKRYVDVLSQEIAGVSINFGQHLEKTIYVPFDHKDTANYHIEWMSWLLQVLDQRQTVVQNANFELTLSLTNLGHQARAPFDTAIMASYVDENEESGLKSMSLRHLGYKQASYEETTQGRDMCELTGQEVLKYGCDDSLVTSHLFDLYRLILQTEGTWEFYRDNEVEPVVDDVFSYVQGMDLDLGLLKQQEAEERAAIDENMEIMRSSLQQNLDQNMEAITAAARVLFFEWYNVGAKKIEDKGLSEAEQDAALNELKESLWTKAWHACFYQPYQEETVEAEFKMTMGFINAVAKSFAPDVPKLEKLNKPGVEDWDLAVSDFLEGKQGEAYDRLDQLREHLYHARTYLTPAKRGNSYEYQSLEAFCRQHNPTTPRTKKTGTELNTGSSAQMIELLYGKLRLPIRRRSKVQPKSFREAHKLEGAPATGLKAIAAAMVHDVTPEDWRFEVLEAYRKIALASQNLSLYFSKLPNWVSPDDGKLHPQIRNCGTATRRPTGTSPNIFQISSKDGSKIRKLFPAGDYGDGERCVISIDLQSQEILVLACESEDETLLNAFQSSPRLDIHSMTGAAISDILLPRLGIQQKKLSYEEFVSALHDDQSPLHDAVKTIRSKYAKACNFLISYLGGPNTLAENLLINIELAKDIMNNTLALYGRIKPWQEEVTKFAEEHGYSETAYGNRRHATADLYSHDSGIRSRMGRQLVNAVIQSTAADILKVIRQEIRSRNMVERYRMRGIRPIYDEMTASVPTELAGAYVEEMAEIMRVTPPGYPVTLDIDVEVGFDWGSQVELSEPTAAAVEAALNDLRQK